MLEGGAPAGPTLLAMHGMPLSAAIFRPHLEYAMRRGVRLVSYDRPGYYPSTARPGRRVGDCEVEVQAVIDALGVDRFGVWGWSAGGPLAIGVAARAPSHVAAVALIGTVAPPDSPGLDWFGELGKLNAVEFRAAQLGGTALSRFLAPLRRELIGARLADVRSAWRSILSGVDGMTLSGEFGDFFCHGLKEGLRRSIAGWRD
ncbi:MAG TPA: alpha/beta fold hydrolase, partial [Thermoplasmata archaeon]|nr:alpha/beta fold hydrolase [Thermoplasmata archaeon]